MQKKTQTKAKAANEMQKKKQLKKNLAKKRNKNSIARELFAKNASARKPKTKKNN